MSGKGLPSDCVECRDQAINLENAPKERQKKRREENANKGEEEDNQGDKGENATKIYSIK